jgi:glutamyl-tRNA reductase
VPTDPSPARHPSTELACDLDQVVVLGATYRDLGTDGREDLAGRLLASSALFSERVLLHTCHRVELIGRAAEDPSPARFPKTVSHWRGLPAVERVFLVAAGLDSAIVAEEQIRGQVRDAYQTALDRGHSGPVTNELMRRAMRFGRRVQSQANPSVDRSLGDRAARWILGRMAGNGTRSRRALVVGTGEMGRRLATGLADARVDVSVASRNLARAEQLARALPGDRHLAITVSSALDRTLDYDGVAIAVRNGTARLETWHLATDSVVVVDLSSPPTVAPEAAEMLGDRLLDLDRLGAADQTSRLSPSAERRLRHEARAEAGSFAAWLATRASGDVIALLRADAEEIRRRHVERLRGHSRLTAAQADAVNAMTTALVGELLHGPTVRLRHRSDAAQQVREIFGIG